MLTEKFRRLTEEPMKKRKNFKKKNQLQLRPLYKKSNTNNGLDCKNCRHANQETNDYSDGFVACKFNGGLRLTKACDISFPLRDGEYYMYEPYTGSNCTWTWDGDFLIQSE